MDSILDNTKKILGISYSYTAFDTDIITHINAVFSTLNQLGIGPEDGFSIEDSNDTWLDFQYANEAHTILLVPHNQLHLIKSYIYLRVRSLFDPPTTSYLIDAMERQIREFEWRLSTFREFTVPLETNEEVVEEEVVWG